MFELGGENTEGLGLYFKKGTLNGELLKLPKPKARYTHDWGDENGLERDTISPMVYEPAKYNISCYIVADDLTDLLAKRISVIEILSNPEGFILKSATLGQSYKLHYIDSTIFKTLNPIHHNGRLYCEFNLVLENDYQATLNQFILEDIDGLILSENDEHIVVQDYEVNF